jgi:F-type H+-transporting ATPase subunit a
MGNPLEHFELHELIPISLFGFDISINEAVVMMWIVVFTVFGLFWLASRSMKSVPGRLQSMVEVVIEFIQAMIRDNMGEEGMSFLPFLSCLFLFILFCNLWGLVPGTYTATSQLIVTGTFAVLVYLISLYVGFARHGLGFFHIFVPPGAPGWILPFVVPIEVISQLARPFSLALRLFANMTAGHTILGVLFGFVIILKFYIGWLPLGFSVFILAFELIVALFQAYIFTLLASIYIGEVIHLHA